MVEELSKAWNYFLENKERFWNAFISHIELDIVCLAICILIAVPLGYICAKHKKIAAWVMNITNILRFIPALAKFIILLPFTGIGFLPAMIALTVMSIPTIIISTMTGIHGVNPKVIESARGMGMSDAKICLEMEIPLAMPMILNGIRTATIEIIAGTTIASYIGASSLGTFILSGLAQNKPYIMLVGAVSVTVLAILIDMILTVVQKKVQKRIEG